MVCLLLNPWICFDTAALALTVLLIFRAERQGSLKQGLARLNATSTFPIMHLICPPKFCIIFVFHFSLGITAVPREIENNAYAKFWGAKKVHYGKCGSGVYGNSFYRLEHNFVYYLCFLAILSTRERYDSMKMFTCFNLTSRVPKQSGMLSHCVVVRVTTL